MRFQITLNMPSRAQSLVHQVIGDADVDSFEEFIQLCNDNPFIIVEEIYKDGMSTKSVGPMGINTAHIGKIKEFTP